MSEVIPAILAKNSFDLEEKIKEVPEELAFAHIDVLSEDVWVQNNLEFEAHLMVDKPEEIFERWRGRGAKRIIVHKYTESMTGVEIGLGLEMQVSVDTLAPILKKIDFVHLMSIVEIGEQGHPMDERIFDRIKEVKEKFPGLPISVDGGINLSNYKKLEEAGAGRLVVGSGFKELWSKLT